MEQINDNKYEYRRDSLDNVHVVYSNPTGEYKNKVFEGYIPPRYTEQDSQSTLAAAPVPPAAPKAFILPPNSSEPLPEKKILGVRRRKFIILLVLFALLVLGVAIGAGVGVAAATKRKHSGSQAFPTAAADNSSPTSTSASQITVYVMPSPTTFSTSTIPTSTALPITHCAQMWEGTAPFCDGKCDSGWTVVRQQALADNCDQSTDTVIIDSCANVSGNSCWSGSKALCQKCEVEPA